jgi:hypothetical protein
MDDIWDLSRVYLIAIMFLGHVPFTLFIFVESQEVNRILVWNKIDEQLDFHQMNTKMMQQMLLVT